MPKTFFWRSCRSNLFYFFKWKSRTIVAIFLDSDLFSKYLFFKQLLFIWMLFKVSSCKTHCFLSDSFFLCGTKLPRALIHTWKNCSSPLQIRDILQFYRYKTSYSLNSMWLLVSDFTSIECSLDSIFNRMHFLTNSIRPLPY